MDQPDVLDQSDVVTQIGDAITELDVELMSGSPPSTSPQWQILYAQRKHLDDQQRELVTTIFQADDDAYKSITSALTISTQALTREIATTRRIDQIITIVSDISATVGQLLAAIP